MPPSSSTPGFRFQHRSHASGISPCEPDRSPLLEIHGLRIRRDALMRLRAEHPKLSDEQLVAALVSGRRAEAHPGKNKKRPK